MWRNLENWRFWICALQKHSLAKAFGPLFDLHLSISNGFVSSKIYDKRDDFDFDIINVPRRPFNKVYFSQLIRFAHICSHVDDLKTHKKCLTAKLLKQGYRYHKLRQAYFKVLSPTQ